MEIFFFLPTCLPAFFGSWIIQSKIYQVGLTKIGVHEELWGWNVAVEAGWPELSESAWADKDVLGWMMARSESEMVESG